MIKKIELKTVNTNGLEETLEFDLTNEGMKKLEEFFLIEELKEIVREIG